MITKAHYSTEILRTPHAGLGPFIILINGRVAQMFDDTPKGRAQLVAALRELPRCYSVVVADTAFLVHQITDSIAFGTGPTDAQIRQSKLARLYETFPSGM